MNFAAREWRRDRLVESLPEFSRRVERDTQDLERLQNPKAQPRLASILRDVTSRETLQQQLCGEV